MGQQLFLWSFVGTNYNLLTRSGPNLEKSPLSLLSALFQNLDSSHNTEMTNHSHTVTYGGQHPILGHQNSCQYTPFELNIYTIFYITHTMCILTINVSTKTCT